MIKISNIVDKIPTSDRIFVDDDLEVDVVPINIGSRLANELGKNLLKAASDGDLNETQKLLYEGAPFTADWLGTSPLHLAAQGNHVEICQVLLRAGISTNARTKVDRTPLHMAAYEGHLDVVQLLLKEEADVDATDLLGMTPLHWAVQNGHIDVVQALVKGGAHVSENKFGLKPLDIAHQIKRLDIVKFLEEEQVPVIIATDNLSIEMGNEDDNLEQIIIPENTIRIEDIDESSSTLGDNIPQIKLECNFEPMDHSLSDSMKILQEHGITLLPNDDDNNILSTVMETGHSVVLTEVGKQILDSVRAEEESAQNITRNLANLERRRYITVNPEDLLTLTTTQSPTSRNEKPKQVTPKETRTIRRVVMKKNKLQPVSLPPNVLKHVNQNVQFVLPTKEADVGSLRKELIEAKRTIEEYKIKLKQKEAEIESYKEKLRLLGYS